MHGIEWLAGIYEGEGSTGIYGKRPTARVSITSTDRDVLETARRVAGVGGIYLMRQGSEAKNWKPCWVWTISRREHIIEVGESILPFLHERRAVKLAETIAWCKQALTKRARTGDGWRSQGLTSHART